jgi:hypothetical protein
MLQKVSNGVKTVRGYVNGKAKRNSKFKKQSVKLQIRNLKAEYQLPNSYFRLPILDCKSKAVAQHHLAQSHPAPGQMVLDC